MVYLYHPIILIIFYGIKIQQRTKTSDHGDVRNTHKKKYELTASLAPILSAQPFIVYGSLTETQMTESMPLALNLSMWLL